MTELRKQVRIELARGELDRLQNEITEWLKERRKGDALQQYRTQLNVIEKMLVAAFSALRQEFNSLAQLSLGALYARCDSLERGLLWERRVWEYFRDKFDQRRDPRYKATLAAADEVVWSCYAEPFRQAGAGAAPRGPTPLPFIEPEYSPQSIARGNTLAVKTEFDAAFLTNYLNALPLPLVALPPRCVEYPWCLIYLVHEVGHHVQNDLAARRDLIRQFGNILKEASRTASPSLGVLVDADMYSRRWESWGLEIFADAFSVASSGAWPVWAMVELERAEPGAMLTAKELYPAPLVRLAWMAALADCWGLPGQAMLQAQELELNAPIAPAAGADAEQAELAAADLACVPSIAEKIAQTTLGEIGSFAQLCDHAADDFANAGIEQIWSETLLGRGNEAPATSLRGARIVLRGAVAAWTEVAKIAEAEAREQARGSLRDRTLAMLADSHEPVSRAAVAEPVVDADGLGSQLTQLVLAHVDQGH